MKPRIVVMGIAFLVLVGVFAWFWSLASVPAIAAEELMLQVDQAPVWVKAEGEDAFREAENGTVLAPGDTVKTEAGGRATITFFGLAQSRLDQNTELVVTEASQNTSTPDAATVHLQLSAGRVWSRVVRLFDLDAGFAVETPGVVATVRGTAFDIAFDANQVTRVWVSESAVDVLPTQTQDRVALLQQSTDRREALANSTTTAVFANAMEVALGAIPAGEMAHYDVRGTPLVHRPLSDEDRASAWFIENTERDNAFITEYAERRRGELAKLGGARPDQWRAGITALSERLHLTMGDERRKEERQEQYLARRLAQLVMLVEDGKSGLAFQEFARLEQDLRNKLRNENETDGNVRTRARTAVMRVMRLVEGVDTRSALYPFKQRMEDLILMLQEGSEPAVFFTRFASIDMRIDEAARLIDEGAWEEALVALDAARNGIENVRRDAKTLQGSFTPAEQETLVGKGLAVFARETAERARFEAKKNAPQVLPTEEMPSQENSTSTRPLPPSSMPDTETPTPAPTEPVAPALPTETPLFTGIRLAVGVGMLEMGVPASLGVIADRADGSNKDVSAQATFRVLSGRGTINGLQFIPASEGTIVLEASYNDNGVVRKAQTAVNVMASVSLQSLTLSPSSANVQSGQRTPITVTATYTDGTTKDVTSSVSWSVSPAANGSMSGNTFIGTNPMVTAGASVTVSVQASYTDAGVTRTGTASFIVN